MGWDPDLYRCSKFTQNHPTAKELTEGELRGSLTEGRLTFLWKTWMSGQAPAVLFFLSPLLQGRE